MGKQAFKGALVLDTNTSQTRENQEARKRALNPLNAPNAIGPLQALSGLLCAHTTLSLDVGGFNCLFLELLLQVQNSPGLSILDRPSSKVEKIPRDSLSVSGPKASE